MQPHSIVLITCWYGPYPWYFPYFVNSIGFSPTINFIIVTDNTEEINNKPDNLKIVYRTIDELKDDFSSKLGFIVNIDSPYKLCDFKPAYGFLFQYIINDYEFWGHTDLDIVFGDVRGFMTNELLQNCDVISCRHDYTAGYFTLYRNTDYCNMLFTKSNAYQTVFSTSKNYWFDECGMLTGKPNLNHSGIVIKSINRQTNILNYRNVFQSMTYVVVKAARDEGLKVHFDFIILDGAVGDTSWKEGKVYYKDMFEAMFYHLILFKKTCKKKIALSPIPDQFFFTTNEVYEQLPDKTEKSTMLPNIHSEM
jgi:hypothetical protein